jgi:transposase
VRRGAPDAVQVADRWHLVHNLAEALERFAVRVLAGLRDVIVEGARSDRPQPVALPVAPPQGRIRPRTEQRHTRVHELLARGLTISAISRQLGLDRKTVRRFARVARPEDLLASGGSRPSRLDPFVPYMTRRWREGCHVAVLLYHELWQLGYRGSGRTVARRVAPWRAAEPPLPREGLPGPRTLAWLLLRRPSELENEDRVLLAKLFGQADELRAAHRLAQRFLVLVRERRGHELDDWVTAALATGPPELRGFGRNLRRDWVAVQRGLVVNWSSGPVEGHINRIKLLKRQMFGRARFDLLRRRVLLAS